MMRRLILPALAGLAVMLGTVPPARAFDLMLDTSGSMQGFQASNAFSPLWSALQEASVSQGGKSYWFAEHSGELKGTPQFDGQATRLHAAVQAWLKQNRPGQPLVIVTDNVADDRDTEDGRAQREFYKSLEHFRFVSMINTRLPFQGTVYAPDYRPGRKEGKADYKGMRALAFYVLSLPPDGRPDPRQEDFPDALATHQAVLDLVRRHSGAVMDLRMLPFDYSNWLVRNGDGAQILRGPARNEGPVVDVIPGKGLQVRDFIVGDDLSFSFQTEVHPGGSFVLKDATISADIKFSDASALLAERLKLPTSLPVTPRVADLSPDPTKGSKAFTITVDIPEFGFLDLPFSEKLRLAMNDAILAEGRITLRYKIESKANVEVLMDSIADWNYEGAPLNLGRSPTSGLRPDDPKIHEKVYHLKSLLYGMLPVAALQNRQEILQTIPVRIELRSSAAPVVSLIALVGAVGATLFYLGSRLLQGTAYLIEDDMGQEQATIPGGFASSSYFASADNRVSGRLTGLGPLFWVSSPDLLRSARLIAGNGPIDIQTRGSDDEEPITYSFRLKRTEHATEAKSSDEWGDNL